MLLILLCSGNQLLLVLLLLLLLLLLLSVHLRGLKIYISEGHSARLAACMHQQACGSQLS
jgi:hypothetical protein